MWCSGSAVMTILALMDRRTHPGDDLPYVGTTGCGGSASHPWKSGGAAGVSLGRPDPRRDRDRPQGSVRYRQPAFRLNPTVLRQRVIRHPLLMCRAARLTTLAFQNDNRSPISVTMAVLIRSALTTSANRWAKLARIRIALCPESLSCVPVRAGYAAD